MTTEQQRFTANTVHEVGVIRRSVAEQLTWAGFGPRHVSEAAIMTGELLTNALRHAGAPATVTLGIRSDAVRVSVQDPGEAWPIVQPLDPATVGGNGLRIVDALADGWGTDPEAGGGKTVWFQLLRR